MELAKKIEDSKLPFPNTARVNGGLSFIEWIEIILGIPQGSILGPISFNVLIKFLTLFINETDICSFADDTTPIR